ncbi:MAG: hypothetical protein JWQ07_5927 [Ramlibacter sp.]|nr:hypothetical protein [Ramlibacter sp.]
MQPKPTIEPTRSPVPGVIAEPVRVHDDTVAPHQRTGGDRHDHTGSVAGRRNPHASCWPGCWESSAATSTWPTPTRRPGAPVRPRATATTTSASTPNPRIAAKLDGKASYNPGATGHTDRGVDEGGSLGSEVIGLLGCRREEMKRCGL